MAKPITVKTIIEYPAGRAADLVAWQTNACEQAKSAVALHCTRYLDSLAVKMGGLASVTVEMTGSDWVRLRTPPFRVTVEGVLTRMPDGTDSLIEKHHPELLVEAPAPADAN